MVLPPYDYFAPASLEEALDLLAGTKEKPLPLAGGTDILVMMKEGRLKPGGLMSLKRLKRLKEISFMGDTLAIGAGVTAGEIERSDIPADNPAFGDLIQHMATRQIRNRATIGGNLCTAAACADFPPVLLVNSAVVTLKSKKKERQVPLAGFFTGPRKTQLGKDELLLSISCRKHNPGSAYIKFGVREAANISIVGVAAAVEVKDGKISDITVASTAASPVPFMVEGAGDVALGKEPCEETWRAVAAEVVKTLDPISDIRGTLDYRLHLAEVGALRALRTAYQRLAGEEVQHG
jgi:CO/xanthine dehydrogenase FAD-binding subunit